MFEMAKYGKIMTIKTLWGGLASRKGIMNTESWFKTIHGSDFVGWKDVVARNNLDRNSKGQTE